MYSCTVPDGRRSPTLIIAALLWLKGGVTCSGGRGRAAEARERDTRGDEEAAQAAVHPAQLLGVLHHAQHPRGECGVADHDHEVDREGGGGEDRVLQGL